MQVPLLDLKAQYATIRDEARAVINQICEDQQFIFGPRLEAFESHIAEYCGTAHAVGVSSGTDALLASLMALGVQRGDGVITTPYTFFATVGSIARLGAVPLFVDIDPVTYNLDANRVRALLEGDAPGTHTAQAKYLMPVHLYGQMADMDPLLALAQQHGLRTIEDAAQAIGAQYPSREGVRRAGSMGDAGCFSFFPSKNLGGFGDGGMVTTQDLDIGDRVRCLRHHGAGAQYQHGVLGGNFRLDSLQAGVLDIKLQHLPEWHAGRRKNAAYYDAAFEGTAIQAPAAVYADSGLTDYHIYNQYVVRVPNRDRVLEGLREANVGCSVYYPVPLHLQECFKMFGYKQGDFPESERAAQETLALPVYPELTREMQEYVVTTLISLVQ
jgi:dTDP-4-amino-4,6-dideoxygalactose transaminase